MGFAVVAEPPSRAQVHDVLQLAEAVLSVYRMGAGVYDRVSEMGTATRVEVDFRCPASSARAAATVLATLQLAVDAAAVAVEYVEQTEYSGGEVNQFVLEGLASTPRFELDIVELSNGSIRGRLRLLATRDGRGKLLNVALIASVVLSGLITAIPSLVIGVLIAANELTPDEKDAQIRALEEELAQVRDETARQVDSNGELRRRIERLEGIRVGGAVSDTDVGVQLDIAA